MCKSRVDCHQRRGFSLAVLAASAALSVTTTAGAQIFVGGPLANGPYSSGYYGPATAPPGYGYGYGYGPAIYGAYGSYGEAQRRPANPYRPGSAPPYSSPDAYAGAADAGGYSQAYPSRAYNDGPYASASAGWGQGYARAPQYRQPSTPPSLPMKTLSSQEGGADKDAGAPTSRARAPALPGHMIQAASAYLNYMGRASDITPHFTAGSEVAKDLKVGVAYEARQFEEGAIAYVAMLALQDPSFVNGVRAAWGGDGRRAQTIAAGLLADPTSALSFGGAQLAAARAGGALRRQGDRLWLAGMKVKQAAYDVQHASWSKASIVEPQARLAGAKTLSSTRFSPGREESDRLLQRALGDLAGPESGSASPWVARGLALAALTVIGQTGQDGDAALGLGSEEKGADCLKMSKLNLFQCLAVAGPHYEDIFCLGQHAMMDTAQCVIAGSGISRALQTASSTPAPRGYWTSRGEARNTNFAVASQ